MNSNSLSGLPETISHSPHGEIRSRVGTLYQRMKNECPWCSQIALDCLSLLSEIGELNVKQTELTTRNIELEYMVENGREADEWWNKIAPQLRDYLGLAEPTIDEAQEEFDNAEEDPLSEERIQEILEYVLNKKKFVPTKYMLNGKKMELFKTYLSFSELVELAGYKKGDTPTIVYYHKDGKKTRAGSLLPGNSVEVLDGMIFNVVHTGGA